MEMQKRAGRQVNSNQKLRNVTIITQPPRHLLSIMDILPVTIGIY